MSQGNDALLDQGANEAEDVFADGPVGSDVGGEDGANPCAGLTCHEPPINECLGDNVKSYNPVGSCDQGECFYGYQILDCPYGCENGVCVGDPCVGVTCTTPPANSCADPSHVTAYEIPGVCTGGACQYATHSEYCSQGCSQGHCTGDSCAGVSCATPPAAYCSDANHIAVYDAAGTCNNGTCSYASHAEFCEFGCTNDGSGPECGGNPCAGIACNSPPANYCANASTARTYEQNGTCVNGTCSYVGTDIPCAFGCAGGACRECSIAQDCGAGKWCDAGLCRACDSNAHCGASCAACGGPTPTCDGNQCVCEGSSCGAYHLCVAGSCTFCDGDAACGSACTSCYAPTPYCASQGTTSSCVQCLTQNNCMGGQVCGANHACVDSTCAPPADSCVTGTQNRSGCTNARVIGRMAAATVGGYAVTDSLCAATNKFDDSSSCWDAGPDHAYRIYLRQNEAINIAMSTGVGCATASWNGTIKVFTNTGCADTSCASKVLCEYNNTNVSKDFVADHDGWFILTVEGSAAFDDEGTYTFTVKLTCNQAGCECP